MVLEDEAEVEGLVVVFVLFKIDLLLDQSFQGQLIRGQMYNLKI